MIDTIYHTGFLVLDREENARLDQRAAALMNLAEMGKVTLYQRRISAGRYEYHCRPVKSAR